jgi:hypothetical protein
MLGLALVALLVLMLGLTIGYSVYRKKSSKRRRRRRRLQMAKAIRLDQFMLNPKEADPE